MNSSRAYYLRGRANRRLNARQHTCANKQKLNFHQLPMAGKSSRQCGNPSGRSTGVDFNSTWLGNGRDDEAAKKTAECNK
jgi:hypothetical protein